MTVFETANQGGVPERFVVDWRLNPVAFVGQERTMLVPERVTSNRGPAGFAMTVVTTESVVFVLGLADEAETLTRFDNVSSRLGRTMTVSLAAIPLLRLPTF